MTARIPAFDAALDERLDPLTAATLMAALPLAVAIVNRGGRIGWRNRRFEEIVDAEATELDALAESGDGGVLRVNLLSRRGARVEVLARCVAAGDMRLMVLEESAGGASDVAELRARIAQLERETMIDALTGTWNHAYFEQALTGEMIRARRYHHALSAAIIDIDGFSAVNERHGHAVADALLREAASIFSASVRMADVLARWSGDRFILLMPHATHSAAAAAAEKLRESIAACTFAAGGPVTVSVGVAELMADEGRRDFVERLNRLLHHAKAEGGDRVVVESSGASDTSWHEVLQLVWRDEYASGHLTIDQEHRDLFRLANAVISRHLGAAPAGELLDAMERCVTHIAMHFAHEERILAQEGYDDLLEHHEVHDRILAGARQLLEETRRGACQPAKMVEFLTRRVVMDHLLGADRDFFGLFGPGRQGISSRA